jgi:hypothetical protein
MYWTILDFFFLPKFCFYYFKVQTIKTSNFLKNNHKHKAIYFLIHPHNRFTFNLFPIYSSLFHSYFKLKSICFNLNWIPLYLISLCFEFEFYYFKILFPLFNSINTNEFYLINYHPSNNQCISNINIHPKSTLNQLYISKLINI